MNESPIVIECRNVSKIHPDGTRALSDVSLGIRKGEFVSIVGPSGAGKSTLLQILGTLDRPTSGEMYIGGNDVRSISDRQLSVLRARHIGFIFQQFHLSPLLDVRSNVAEGLLYRGVANSERQRRAGAILERLGMSHRLRHRPNMLSGGERQRVAIARALVGQPEIILADEPTGNLDSVNGSQIVEILKSLSNDGTGVVIVTHDTGVARLADRTISIRDGAVEDVVQKAT